MMNGRARGLARRLALFVGLSALLVSAAQAAPRPRPILIVPFDTVGLAPEDAWLGEAVAQVLALGLAQHPAFVQVDRARLRAVGQPEAWGDAVVAQAARALKVDAVLYGTVSRSGTDLLIRPRLLEVKGGATDTVALEPVTAGDVDLLARLAELPVAYARTLRVALTEAERARIERAARPTRSLKALELFARGQAAFRRGGQEGNETAVELLSRAVEVDPNFVVAHYTLGVVHQALGNRWKAAAQYRATTQLDPTFPEAYKALGDLFLTAPRRLFDQAVEAYSKAIELRPFYAEAHMGLGDARAAKGDVDGAIAAYQRALAFNPTNPRAHLSLGRIYYGEKGLYYEAVAAYKKALELDPLSLDARMGLGEIYEDKGLYKEAIEEYRKVIEIDPKHTGALYNLAIVYEKVDPREAIAQWERYIAIASQLPSEKDWVDVARQHLRKLRNQLKE